MNQVTEYMLHIKSMDPHAVLSLTLGGDWYVSSSIYTYDPTKFNSEQTAVCWDGSPLVAVSNFFQTLVDAKAISVHSDPRRYYKWNGVCFALRFE